MTTPFHGGNTGSNPVGDANISNRLAVRWASLPILGPASARDLRCPQPAPSGNRHRLMFIPSIARAMVIEAAER